MAGFITTLSIYSDLFSIYEEMTKKTEELERLTKSFSNYGVQVDEEEMKEEDLLQPGLQEEGGMQKQPGEGVQEEVQAVFQEIENEAKEKKLQQEVQRKKNEEVCQKRVKETEEQVLEVREKAEDLWKRFVSSPLNLSEIQPKQVDCTIISPASTWQATAKKIAKWIAKIILFPWAVFEGVQFLQARVISPFILYMKGYSSSNLDKIRKEAIQAINSSSPNDEIDHTEPGAPEHYTAARQIIIQKDAKYFSGVILANKSKPLKSGWLIYVPEKFLTYRPYEMELESFLSEKGGLSKREVGEEKETENSYLRQVIRQGCHILFLNPIHTGRSQGGWFSSPDRLEAKEVGKSFLEEAMQAKTTTFINREGREHS